MKLRLNRFASTAEGFTLGALFIDGVFSCFTLEDEFRAVKVAGETRIPAGTYLLSLRFSPSHSPKYGHKMISVEAVPGFTGILFHKGNTTKDTEGCILVGNIANCEGTIAESTLAYNRIYPIVAPKISSGEIVTLVVSDPPTPI